MRAAPPEPGPRPSRSFRASGAVLACALALAAPARAQAPTAAESSQAKPAPVRRVDARTDELMRKMSSFLAQSPRFALEAEETFDEVSENAPRLQLTNVRRVAVARPDKLAADATGDTMNRATVYDGRQLTVLDKERNTYVTAEAPATIDATLDAIAERFGVVVPLSDLVYSDPYSVLMEGVLYGEYRGIHQAAGVACHHLAFTQEDIEWQLWIDAGDEPLPRKLLITYVDEPGSPQYSATIRRWTLKPAFTDELFRFEAPEGATRIELDKIVAAPAPAAADAAKTDAVKKEDK